MFKSFKSFINSFKNNIILDRPNIRLNIKPKKIVDGKIITGKGRRLKALPRPLLPTRYTPPPERPIPAPRRPIPKPRINSKRPVPAPRPKYPKAIERDIKKFTETITPYYKPEFIREFKKKLADVKKQTKDSCRKC